MKTDHITEEMMVDYVLGNLSREKYFKVQAHLRHCDQCCLDVLAWEKYLHGTIEEQPSRPIQQRLWGTIDRFKRRSKRAFLSGAVALCLIGFLGFLYVSFHKEEIAKEDKQQNILVEGQIYTVNPTEVENQSLPTLPINYERLNNNKVLYQILSQSLLPSNERAPVGEDQFVKQLFVLQDGSICSIDSIKKQIHCVVYTVEQKNKLVPTHTKTIDLMRD